MDRHQLEDRIRTSLDARAHDVQATPELWDRVATRTTRQARWRLGGWVLSGVAAAVALVVGGVVLLGGPRGVQIDREPDVVHSVPETSPATPQPTPTAGGTGGTPVLVTTDGSGSLFRVDPTTGRVLDELPPYEGFLDGGAVREVAVRPVLHNGGLTVATVVEREGTFDIEVTVFDAEGQRVDRVPLGIGTPASELPPDLVWSADGRYLLWAGDSVSTGQGAAGPALWAYDWVERPMGPEGAFGEPFPVGAPGAPAALFDGTGTVDLREWVGTTEDATVVATTTEDGAFRLRLAGSPSDCGGATPCPPTFDVQAEPLRFPGLAAVDLGTLSSGINLALGVPEASTGGDAESATLALVAEPTEDDAQRLELPELTAGTAAPPDGWLAAAGDRVAVGFGGQAHLLTLTGERAGEVEITSTVPLPEGTTGASLTLVGAPSPAPTETASANPTNGPTETSTPAVADDGLPTHVVSRFESADTFLLQDRRAPDEPVATWSRPEGLVPEYTVGTVAVHPDSTPDDLRLVSRWSLGEADVLVRTVVQDGQVVVNEPLPDDLQPSNVGGLDELGDSAPVFSPGGEWLAWVEAPQGADGPARIRMIAWTVDGPTGTSREIPAPDGTTRPLRLLDWAATSDGDVLTMAPAWSPDTDARAPTTMVELRLQVTSGLIPETTDDAWRTVDLPGQLLDAGSFALGDGAQRYVTYAGGDEVLYGLAEAPESAVPTGAFVSGEGRVVAFGPDSALVQRPDGSWQRVQVDDGAASAVDVPRGAMAVLPWPAG